MIGESKKSLNSLLINSASVGSVDGMVKAIVVGADINTVDPNTKQSAAHICAHNWDTSGLALFYPDDDTKAAFREGIDYNIAPLIDQFGSVEEVERRWLESVASFNPLIRDKDGRLPSSLYPNPGPLMNDREAHKLYDLQDMMSWSLRLGAAEMSAAESQGLALHEVFRDHSITLLTRNDLTSDDVAPRSIIIEP